MKKFILILGLAFIGYIFTSFILSSPIGFGFPFTNYYPPIDCRYNADPAYICEGRIEWKTTFVNSAIWISISFFSLKIFEKRNTLLFGKKIKVIAIVSLVILIIIYLFYLQVLVAKDYFNQNLTCGGIRGEICPVGFHCPESKYPDELKQCVSVIELLRRR
ncbi:MAG TPA: hypothetical protein PLS49_02565 [Candidatus Woesebacteria bacterium]|nr:hypothetical protein [Candidatus Woesebacteria bacterium]